MATGSAGGTARAAKLSKARRSEIARQAAQARWIARQDPTVTRIEIPTEPPYMTDVEAPPPRATAPLPSPLPAKPRPRPRPKPERAMPARKRAKPARSVKKKSSGAAVAGTSVTAPSEEPDRPTLDRVQRKVPVCAHPRARRINLGYAIKCSACGSIVR